MRRLALPGVLLVLILSSCGRADLYVLRGNQSYSQGNYGQATISYLKALEWDQQVPYIRYNLAGVFYALGETGPAREALEEALAGEGQELLYRTRLNLGNIFFDQGRYSEAVEQFVEALRVKPDQQYAQYRLELALKKLTSSGQVETRPREQQLQQTTVEILDKIRRQEALWRSEERAEKQPDPRDW